MDAAPSVQHTVRRCTRSVSLTQTSLHQNVIEEVLTGASRVVELRIAQFRALLVVFLLVFNFQAAFSMGVRAPSALLYAAMLASFLALAFSAYVIWTWRQEKEIPITALSIVSIGVDVTLLALPVSFFFSVARGADSPFHGPLLNQPTVFAMYLLVIASGLRFREAARFGIAVNSCVVLCMMAIEAMRASTPNGLEPISSLAIRQHAILLIGSVLLAWFISVHTRTTTLKAAETALRATVDGLTGVYNRHHLRQQLEQLCQNGATFHLLMTDVDHFKSINDELGHLTGDRVLTEVAKRLQQSLRSDDQLARYGGEEFCVLLSGVDDGTAQVVAERLRTEVCKTPMEGRTVSVSVGLSRWDGQEPLSELLDRADKGLYKAKEGGRNQVVTMWPNP